jgi:hypothetical protein
MTNGISSIEATTEITLKQFEVCQFNNGKILLPRAVE